MVQRLQTIYLLIAAILMAVTVFSPLASFIAEGAAKEFFYYTWGFESVVGEMFSRTWGVIVFTVLCAILPFINIFLFKSRKLQMKIGNITTFLILFLYLTIGVYAFSIMRENSLVLVNAKYGIILPLIALICNVLAILQIKKDEKLVQSLNRIR
jgi:hypothetical protein